MLTGLIRVAAPFRVEEMAQKLTAPILFAQDLGSIPAPTWWFTIISSFREPRPSSDLLGLLHACCTYTYTN